jgi:hypothetical protein
MDKEQTREFIEEYKGNTQLKSRTSVFEWIWRNKVIIIMTWILCSVPPFMWVIAYGANSIFVYGSGVIAGATIWFLMKNLE